MHDIVGVAIELLFLFFSHARIEKNFQGMGVLWIILSSMGEGRGMGGTGPPVKRRNMIDDMERRLEKLEKEDVSKVKKRVKALAAQWDPS